MADPAWVALSLSRHIGGKKLRALLNHFDHDLKAILSASEADLQQVAGVGPKIAAEICRIDLAMVEKQIEKWQQAGVRIITRRDAEFPAELLTLEDEPPTLFVRGQWKKELFSHSYALVGTRSPSRHAQEAAYKLGAALAERGCTVVSGLAVGIDSSAHRGALSVPTGITAAVLGSGVLNIYPPENRPLAEKIMERGVILCEVSPDTTVNSAFLVARNRIITGLCERLIVVETGINGGAMYAARRALEQGRPIYTLDLPANGNQTLLAEGAELLPLDLDHLGL